MERSFFHFSIYNFNTGSVKISLGVEVNLSLIDLAILKFIIMSICADECAEDLPVAYAQGCENDTRRGGMNFAVFMKCNVAFTDITDTAEWTSKIQSGDVVASAELLGEKPKPSFTKKKVSSRRPEIVTGRTETFNFQDHNAKLDDNGDLEFWDKVQTNYRKYQVLFLDDHDNVYGFYPDFSPEIGNVIPNDTKENAHVDGTIALDLPNGLMKPSANVPGLTAIIESTVQVP